MSAPSRDSAGSSEDPLAGRSVIRFAVRGLPIQQGSARAFVVPGKGGAKPRAVITHDSRRDLGLWRRLVSEAAQSHAPSVPWDGPIAVRLSFGMPKPKSRPKRRRTWPDRRPDLDKLIRACLDSLTHIVFADDSQVVRIHAEKDYGVPGVTVIVERVGD